MSAVFAALGTGVIGAGWIARALARGLTVRAWDPAPGAEAAWPMPGRRWKPRAWHPLPAWTA